MKKFLFLAAAVLTSFSASAEQLQFKLTDMAGNIFTGTYEGTKGSTQPSFDHCHYTFKDAQWDGITFSATIDFGMPVSKVDGTTNHTLITQTSWFSEGYKNWVAEDGNVMINTATPNISELGMWYWAIYPTFDGHTFKFYIKNIGTDKYVYINPGKELTTLENGRVCVFDEEGAIQLKTTGTAFSTHFENGNFRFHFDYTKGGNSYHMHMSIDSQYDTYTYLGYSDLDGIIIEDGEPIDHTHRNNNSFRDITQYNVTIGSTGYVSIYTPISVYPKGIKGAYAVTHVGANNVTLTKKKNIKAGNVAIINAKPGTYTFVEDKTTASWANWSDNLLKGTMTNTLINVDAYVLSAPGGVAGFYLAEKNKDANGNSGNTHFLNNAFKAYLPVPTGSGARLLSFDFGTETAIEEIEAESTNAEIFDLSGRRVQKAQKGIYVVNGKVVIK